MTKQVTTNEVQAMAITTARVQSVTYKNEKLNEQTKAINSLLVATKRNMLEIAFRIKVVNDNKLFELDGFKSVHEWTAQAFGYKSAMSYQMLATANNYLEDGKDGVKSILIHDDGRDYTASQLQELNRIDPSEARTLDNQGTIDPAMNCKEIRAIALDYKRGDIDATGNKTSKGKEKDAKKNAKASSVKADSYSQKVVNAIAALEALASDEATAAEIVKLCKGMCVKLNSTIEVKPVDSKRVTAKASKAKA